MQKIHPGQEVVSLFGIGSESQKQYTHVNPSKQRFVLTLIAAFFIVFVAAVALNFINERFEDSAVIDSLNDPAAFQPGKFVSERIYEGYVGR